MLELQSLQKEQQRHEQLLKIQQNDECSVEVTVPLRKVATVKSGTNQQNDGDGDARRLNNNRDSFHFENDANNDDDVGTTVADDIIVVKGDRNNESTLSHGNHTENDTNNSAMITVNDQPKIQMSTSIGFYFVYILLISFLFILFPIHSATKFGHRSGRWL